MDKKPHKRDKPPREDANQAAARILREATEADEKRDADKPQAQQDGRGDRRSA